MCQEHVELIWDCGGEPYRSADKGGERREVVDCAASRREADETRPVVFFRLGLEMEQNEFRRK